MFTRNRRFAFECLEQKRLLAADVYLNGGALEIKADGVNIGAGVNDAGQPMLVVTADGEHQRFPAPNRLSIDARATTIEFAGNFDFDIHVQPTLEPDEFAFFSIRAVDYSTLSGDITYVGGAQNDVVDINNATFLPLTIQGDVTINLNPEAAKTEIGFDFVNTHDQLRIEGNLTIDGGNARAFVSIDAEYVGGNTLIKTGSEDDSIGISQTHFAGDLTIQTQKGDDIVAGNNALIDGAFTFIGGQGEDDVADFLDDSTIKGPIKILQAEII